MLIGLLLVSIFAAGIGDLLVVALGSIRDAREETSAVMLAVQKVEQLRSAASNDGSLTLSPEDALERSAAGFSDMVDALGEAVSASSGTPRSTVYVRRWSVRPLPSSPPGGVALHVLVSSVRRAARWQSVANWGGGAHADVLLTSAMRSD